VRLALRLGGGFWVGEGERTSVEGKLQIEAEMGAEEPGLLLLPDSGVRIAEDEAEEDEVQHAQLLGLRVLVERPREEIFQQRHVCGTARASESAGQAGVWNRMARQGITGPQTQSPFIPCKEGPAPLQRL
jgi:hypothetical protein